METEKRVYRRKKDKKVPIIRIILILGIFIYAIMFVYTFFVSNIGDTINIEYGTVEIKEMAEGYITRNEHIVSADIMGEVYPIVLEGERVSKNQSVAVIKNDNSEEIENKIKDIKNKLSHFSTPTILNNDIKILESEVDTTLNKLMLGNYNENFSTLNTVRNKIEEKLSKKAIIIGQAGGAGSQENLYYTELKNYEGQLTNTQREIVAPIAGTVAYKLDGYENVFSYSAIGNYDIETLENMNVPYGELVGTVKPNSFKIVDNIEGYVTVISDSKEALDVKVDKKIKLRFPEISSQEVIGKVEYVTIENDKAVITLRINRMIEDLLNYRKIKVEMIWDSEEGFVVPSTSIRHENDKTNKVFVINGKRAIEKQVEVLIESEGKAVIKDSKGHKIVIYDEIAKDASKIKENKIIKID